MGAVLLVLPLLVHGTSAAQELPFAHYTTESSRNPLPSAAVTGVHQDALGYVWFSVFSTGLVRYDGRTMEAYGADDGLPDLGVYRLVEDASGRLWVGARGGVAVSDRPLQGYANGERVRFTSQWAGLPLPTGTINTNAIAAGIDGGVWVGTASAGLLRLLVEDNSLRVDTVRVSEPAHEAITAVVAGRSGTVWVATLNGLLHTIHSPGYAGPIEQHAVGEDGYISALHETTDGELWAGTQKGWLLRIHSPESGARFQKVSTTLEALVTSIVDATGGSIWVSSEGGGVLRYDPFEKREEHLTFRDGLLSESVHEIAVDAEGNIWLAQLGGVSKLRFNFDAFSGYTATPRRGEKPTLPSASVGAIAVDDRDEAPCAIWAGTPDGGIACIRADGISEYVQADRGLRSDLVNALAVDGEGDLWVGGQHGIQRLSFDESRGPSAGRRSITVGGRRGWLEGFGPTQVAVFTISQVRMPRIAGASQTVESLCFGGWDLFCRVEGTWFILGSPSGLPRTRLHGVAFDDEGRLWVGTQGEGVFRSTGPVDLSVLRREENRQIVLPNAEGGEMQASVVSSVQFQRLQVDAIDATNAEVFRLVWYEGRMFAASANGLLVLEPTTGTEEVRAAGQLERVDGLGADFTMSLGFAPRTRTLWVGTNAGLSEVDPHRLEVIRTLTSQDGLVGNEGWYSGSLVVGNNGTVYYGTARGLTAYRPWLDAPNPVLPPIALRSARFIHDRTTNEFTADYAALGFVEESRIQYRTRLVGYDAGWSPPTIDSRIRYTNLPAFFMSRSYTLEVLATNSSGIWTPAPLRFSFSVPPPLWLTWWAILVYTSLVGIGIVVAYSAQRARLIRQERSRAQMREAELRADAALARSNAAEAQARALEEENRRKEAELEKARELEQAYNVLKVTQNQLIQSEKLASLGQLTAGIAHEIKNPLNFVTNFAALTREVADELIERCESEPDVVLKEVLDDLEIIQMNTQKIEEHGLRADGIVRSMLEHSRGGTGERRETDINALIEQYANLAYHGERARTAGFDVQVERDYDPDAGSVELVPQEMGRVLLNLLDNAFYAVNQRALSSNGSYVPKVTLSTRKHPQRLEIRVADNGSGIPESVRQKIFEPFFTTKPTGKGTGLGLSLSHNIVVQGCGGEFLVESDEGTGTTFVIRLPREGADEAVVHTE